MEFVNEFRVPADIDETFAALADLERVAPCLPGATLEEVDGDTYTGRVKVKVGPMSMTYRGTARVSELDHENKVGRIEARGRDTHGAGTATADVVAHLSSDGTETTVRITTDLNVTGKPAQFGRSVMDEVGNQIVAVFAERLREMIGEGTPEDIESKTVQDAGRSDRSVATAPSDGPRRIPEDLSRQDDALNLVDVAGAATAKRVVPVLALVLVAVGIVWFIRRC